jgi:hypothetical protein
MPWAGTAWRPALYGGQHSACSGALQGAPSTHAPGKRLCDGTQGYDGHSVTDSTFPMPLVAQLAAGFGSLAVRSIRNAAEWTLDTWCATVDAHPGGDAPALAEFRVPAGSGAPGRKHDYSRAPDPGAPLSGVGVSHAPAGKRPSGRGHLVSDYGAIT